jgi:hypothetical protein
MSDTNADAARARGAAMRQQRVARARTIRRRIVSGSVALFVAAWLLITIVLVSGHDPALASHSSAATVTSSSGSGTATTSAATITVLKDVVPKVTVQPANKTVAPGATVAFGAGASGEPTPTAQWEVSTNGGSTWTNVSGGTATTVSGGMATTLIFAATAAENGWDYRAVFMNPGGSATTKMVALKVT